jgi:uncharacterized protein (TIGR03545 family)
MAKKEIKSVAKKEPKQFPAKKLPGLFKKSYTEKKLDHKILKKLYVPEDKKFVEALFSKGANPSKPELYAASMSATYSKKDIVRYRQLAKQIKRQKGRINWIPLVAVVGAIAALVIVVNMFKNPITKKIIKSGCEAAFGAKTDIGSVDLKIFSASLTVNNLAVGNKNSVMKNLFQVDKIAVDFNLVQALRGRFDAQNLEVLGVALNTDRKTSCELPKKQKKASEDTGDNAFVESLKAKSTQALDDLKAQAADMLGGTDVDSIVANIKGQLKTPAMVETTKTTVTDLTNKWKDKPTQIQKQVSDFSTSVQSLQTLDISKIKDAATLKTTLEQVNSAITAGNKLKEEATTTTNDIKADAASVKKLGEDVKTAVESDTQLAKDKLASAVSAVKNAKTLLNNALDTVGYDMLGKYYPYAKKLVNYAVQMKASSASSSKDKKPKAAKKKAAARLKGTTFWYGTTNPRFLIEHIKATGTGFSAEGTEITSDQDVRGKPTKFNGTYVAGDVTHAADLVLDARSKSTAPLLAVNYSGNGFTAAVDGTTIASKSGVPSVNGKAFVKMSATAGSDGFTASGSVNLNPLALTSDGFDNETVTKYYNQALASVKNMSIGFKAGFTQSQGVSLALDGNFADQFANALKTVLASMGSDAKDAALKKIQDELNNSSNGVLADIKSFAGIEGDIDLQNAKLSDVQKALDSKKTELEKKIKEQATNAAASKVDEATGGAASKLKGALKF